jgi:uncharacterized protein (TIGR01370 family)
MPGKDFLVCAGDAMELPIPRFTTAFGRLFQAIAMVSLVAGQAVADPPTLALFYGNPVPIDSLILFDQVVVEADNLETPEPLAKAGVEAFAYVSIGEAESWRASTAALPPAIFIGDNPNWGNRIADLSHPDWQRFLLENRMAELWARGYRGFFLDTLDSYRALPLSDRQRAGQQAALIEFIRKAHDRFPGVKLLANRGFDILPQIAPYLAGLVAESVFSSWNPKTKSYVDVSDNDREWLLVRLREARDRYRLPVTVVDYLPPSQRQKARETAQRIAALGFTPWISNAPLDMVGIGRIEIQPRRIAALYDGKEFPDFRDSPAHRWLTLPLEQMGLAVDPVDVRGGLPEYPLIGRYAGIVTWFADDAMDDPERYKTWLIRQMDQGVPVAVFGRIGIAADAALLSRMGLRLAGNPGSPLSFAAMDDLIGWEVKPVVLKRDFPRFEPAAPALNSHLALADAQGRRLVAVATGAWGGLALDPYATQAGPHGKNRWIVDPFAFLRRALGLAPMPALDTTTLNGRRILTVQIEGDGAPQRAEMPGTPLAVDVVRKNLIEAYPFPTTVSTVESEISPDGVHPELANALEQSFKALFNLPHVEAASHSYSHPQQWGADPMRFGLHDDDYPIALPKYRFDLHREIAGSTQYMKTRLLPAGKPVRVFLWTGEARPSADAVALTRKLGLYNVGGTGAKLNPGAHSLTEIPPVGAPVAGGYQVYAGIASDNAFTNNWQPPFYNYRQAIETFALTDTPLRLKPININYHFYSGAKAAALNALKGVYEWASKQETFPLFVSEYARLVEDFQKASFARRQDGLWEIRGLRSQATLKLPAEAGWPDLERSEGVLGVRDVAQGRFVHLLPREGKVVLALAERPPAVPYLIAANAFVTHWEAGAEGIRLGLRGHRPIALKVKSVGSQACLLNKPGNVKVAARRESDAVWSFDLSDSVIEDAYLSCE